MLMPQLLAREHVLAPFERKVRSRDKVLRAHGEHFGIGQCVIDSLQSRLCIVPERAAGLAGRGVVTRRCAHRPRALQTFALAHCAKGVLLR